MCDFALLGPQNYETDLLGFCGQSIAGVLLESFDDLDLCFVLALVHAHTGLLQWMVLLEMSLQCEHPC